MKLRRLFSVFAVVSTLTLTSCATTDLIANKLIESDDASDVAVGNAIKSIKKAQEEFTPENEYYVGRSVAAAVLKKYSLYKSAPEVTEYLNEICSAITVNSSQPYLYKGYSVGIIDSNEINAISTPGGHILISRGLINSTSSEDELAAVIAHEVAHIQLKHSVMAIKSSRNSAAALSAAKAASLTTYDVMTKDNKKNQKIKQAASGLWDVQNTLLTKLLESGFSKNQEYKADTYALTLMIDAGYDPNAMTEMLGNIKKNKVKGGWSKTHPSAASRKNKVEKKLIKMTVPETTKAEREKRFNKIVKTM